MLIDYKYKFWEAMARFAPSPEEQERVIGRIALDLGISKRRLKSYLNLKYQDKKDLPTGVFLTLCKRLDLNPVLAVNYMLPEENIYDSLNADRLKLMKKYGLSKPTRKF